MSLYSKFFIGMFTYGFIRGMRSEYKPPYDIIGYRLANSMVNGLCYTFPPYGVFRLFDIANRADVYLQKKDPEKYPSIYYESIGINKHVFI